MLLLKTIQYRGGIARFRLPVSWVEEFEPRGGGVFYEPGDDSGTLRINVLDFEQQHGSADFTPTAFDLLTRTRGIEETEALPAGTAVARYVTQGEESGQHLRIYNWQIGVCVSATHFRIVVFTYTIIDGREREKAMQIELRLLDSLIVSGEYPAVGGVAGDFYHGPATI